MEMGLAVLCVFFLFYPLIPARKRKKKKRELRVNSLQICIKCFLRPTAVGGGKRGKKRHSLRNLLFSFIVVSQ